MRVFLSIPQHPFDPAAGDARSMRTVAEMLATQGVIVSALATTASFSSSKLPPIHKLVPGLGHVTTAPATGDGCPVLNFLHRGIDYTLLDCAGQLPETWPAPWHNQFDRLFHQHLTVHPDAILTYGGSPADVARRELACRQGCRVVFGLRGFGYLKVDSLQHIDAFIPCSEFVAARYRQDLGITATVLPLPINVEDVVAPRHDPLYLTFINPTHAKGVMFFARLAEMLAKARPDIPIRVVESRGTDREVIAAGLAGGFDLRQHPNLKVIRNTPRPADIYAKTRVLLVPSLWDEPAGRVPVEAMMNAIPPIVSNRGGLPEVCRDGAFVLPIPPHIRPFPPRPVSCQDAQPWFDLIVRLWDDQPFYQQASHRALAAATYYATPKVAQQYAAFFRAVCSTTSTRPLIPQATT